MGGAAPLANTRAYTDGAAAHTRAYMTQLS